MYIIYHKFAGYLISIESDEYTSEIKDAYKFNTFEEADLEISGYLERVEKVKTEGEMAKFKVHNKVILKANVVEDWPEELGVIIEVEDQNKYPGMYIVQVIETPILMEDIDDGIREIHEDNLMLK